MFNFHQVWINVVEQGRGDEIRDLKSLTLAQTAQLVMIKSRLQCEKTEDNNDEYFALINLLQCLKFTGIQSWSRSRPNTEMESEPTEAKARVESKKGAKVGLEPKLNNYVLQYL